MYIHGWTCKGDVRLPAGNRPTNHHPYICVLKGIPEYILHMLYCRLISNSIGREASRARGRSGERERGGRRKERESARFLARSSQRTIRFDFEPRECSVFLRVFARIGKMRFLHPTLERICLLVRSVEFFFSFS